MPSSGNPDLDRYLGKALERLADSFKIYPGFAFVDDSGSPNAYAMRETLLPSYAMHGAVWLEAVREVDDRDKRSGTYGTRHLCS
jgi:hypothetical protein